MSDNQHTEHSITVDAPARSVYDLIADVTRWPAFFTPTVHARVLEHRDGRERIQLWAYANGEVRTWTSRRELDPDRLRVDFRQEVSSAPVAAMGGQWRMEPLDEERTRLVLTHDYRAVDDDPAGEEWIARAVDRNSQSELAGVKKIAEEHARLDELLLTFEDEVEIAGAAPDVFDFLNRADEWPERLPHVDRLELREDTPRYPAHGDGHPDGRRLGAHHHVGAGLLLAHRHRLQADPGAEVDDRAHGGVAVGRGYGRRPAHLPAHGDAQAVRDRRGARRGGDHRRRPVVRPHGAGPQQPPTMGLAKQYAEASTRG